MRVLHLISSAGWYGAENLVVNIAAASHALGCDVVVGVLRDKRNPHAEAAEEAQARGVPAEIFDCGGRFDWKTIAALRRYLRHKAVDVLHTHGYKADFYGFWATRGGKASWITTCHTGAEQPETTPALMVYNAINRFLIRRVDRVVAVSPALADSLLERVGTTRLCMIPNSVDPARFLVPRRKLDGPKVVGFVGRLIREKGIYCLLDAARQVVAEAPDTQFIVAGDGPEGETMERSAAQAGLVEHIRFLGVCGDMPAVYASMDVFTLPSFSEGTPMTVLEAMAAGLPVVATRVGGIPPLLEPAGCGILCEPGDAGGLAQALLRVLRDDALARALGAAARQHINEQYSSEAMARRYLELYAEIRR